MPAALEDHGVAEREQLRIPGGAVRGKADVVPPGDDDTPFSLNTPKKKKPKPGGKKGRRPKAMRSHGLVIAGGYDVGLPPNCAARYAELFPFGDTVVLEGSGHAPWVDRPDRFREVVNAFLARRGDPDGPGERGLPG
jgi:hypothetical protein